jgi:hypothetical protein
VINFQASDLLRLQGDIFEEHRTVYLPNDSTVEDYYLFTEQEHDKYQEWRAYKKVENELATGMQPQLPRDLDLATRQIIADTTLSNEERAAKHQQALTEHLMRMEARIGRVFDNKLKKYLGNREKTAPTPEDSPKRTPTPSIRKKKKDEAENESEDEDEEEGEELDQTIGDESEPSSPEVLRRVFGNKVVTSRSGEKKTLRQIAEERVQTRAGKKQWGAKKKTVAWISSV